jgi:predicted Kef-type K+ transport protein
MSPEITEALATMGEDALIVAGLVLAAVVAVKAARALSMAAAISGWRS